MSRLTPVVREDKNGKSTTRWVREQDAASTRASRIPAPSAAPARAAPMLAEVFREAANTDVTIDPRAALRLEELLHDPHIVDFLPRWIRFALVCGNARRDLHNLAALTGSINYRDDGTDPSIWAYIEGLGHEESFRGVSDFLLASPRKLEQANAYLYAASRLGDGHVEFLGGGNDTYYSDSDYEYDEETGEYEPSGDYGGGNDSYEPEYVSICDRKLVSLILTHPRKAQQIVSDINDEKIRDTNLLRERVLHPEQVLRGGLL